jgi:hypothetical protein
MLVGYTSAEGEAGRLPLEGRLPRVQRHPVADTSHGLSARPPDRYLAKSHQPKNNHGIAIANPPTAIKITSRLNFRIRLSYSCAQLISPSLTGLRRVALIHAILMGDKIAH